MAKDTLGIEPALEALLDEGKKLSKHHLQRFSDADPEDLRRILEVWPRVAARRKHALLDALLVLLESDTLVSFDQIAKALLNDADPAVRARAIKLLAECDDVHLVPTLIGILQKDPEVGPRQEAAVLLGEFVLLGELEQLPKPTLEAAEEALLTLERGQEPPEVRRGALKALGYSSRPEVPALIEAAYGRQDSKWVASGLVAMGRSSDDRWEEKVIASLIHEDAQVRLAAVEAAGELSLSAARQVLLMLLEDEDDEAVIAAAIWSLSEIGGEDVRIYLQSLLDKAEDEVQTALLEDALDNLSFTEDMEQFDLIALDPDEPD